MRRLFLLLLVTLARAEPEPIAIVDAVVLFDNDGALEPSPAPTEGTVWRSESWTWDGGAITDPLRTPETCDQTCRRVARHAAARAVAMYVPATLLMVWLMLTACRRTPVAPVVVAAEPVDEIKKVPV